MMVTFTIQFKNGYVFSGSMERREFKAHLKENEGHIEWINAKICMTYWHWDEVSQRWWIRGSMGYDPSRLQDYPNETAMYRKKPTPFPIGYRVLSEGHTPFGVPGDEWF